MDRDKAIQILNRSSSTKDELRRALAFVLGVELAIKAEKPKSVFGECKDFFLRFYEAETGLSYQFDFGKDGKALKTLIERIGHSKDVFGDPALTKVLFEEFITKLPSWYKTHGFSLSVISSKYNELLVEQNHGKAKKGNDSVGVDYLQGKLDILNG